MIKRGSNTSQGKKNRRARMWKYHRSFDLLSRCPSSTSPNLGMSSFSQKANNCRASQKDKRFVFCLSFLLVSFSFSVYFPLSFPRKIKTDLISQLPCMPFDGLKSFFEEQKKLRDAGNPLKFVPMPPQAALPGAPPQPPLKIGRAHV